MRAGSSVVGAVDSRARGISSSCIDRITMASSSSVIVDTATRRVAEASRSTKRASAARRRVCSDGQPSAFSRPDGIEDVARLALGPLGFDQTDDRHVVEVAVARRAVVEQLDALPAALRRRTCALQSSGGWPPPTSLDRPRRIVMRLMRGGRDGSADRRRDDTGACLARAQRIVGRPAGGADPAHDRDHATKLRPTPAPARAAAPARGRPSNAASSAGVDVVVAPARTRDPRVEPARRGSARSRSADIEGPHGIWRRLRIAPPASAAIGAARRTRPARMPIRRRRGQIERGDERLACQRQGVDGSETGCRPRQACRQPDTGTAAAA